MYLAALYHSISNYSTNNMRLLYGIFACVLFIQCATSLRILGLFPYNGKSHFFVFKTLLEELTKRGHDVTVVSHFPNPKAGYKEISLAGTMKVFEDDIPLQQSYFMIFGILDMIVQAAADTCEKMMEVDEVQKLWKTNQKFDLVVTEQFTGDCSLGVAYKLGVPVVGLTSGVLLPHHYPRTGAPDNLGFVPFILFGGGSNPTFFQRFEAAVFRTYQNYMNRKIAQSANKQTLEKHFGPIPELDELAKDVKFVLVYQYFPLTGSRLLPPNVVEVGGYHVGLVMPLPEDIRKFIEESKHGVIYVSFGSLVKASTLSSERLSAIMNAFAKLKQRVIWKWENDTLPGNPPNILPKKWLPQNDILAHPKVVAFYSHSGMLSTTEAIHHGVPMVAMPVLGDQPSNAAAVRESGLGVELQIADLSEETLLDKLQQVLKPEFRARVKELSRAWHDRPLPAMDTAVFWTEFAARHAGRSWRAHAVDVPLYRYYSLDLIAATAVVICVVFLLIINCCCRRNGAVKTKSINSKSKAKKS